jgi:hypothetical protein
MTWDKIYLQNGDVNTAGNTVGTILPIVSGANGITSVVRMNTPVGAVVDLIGFVVALYPPYLVFAVIHDEFMRGRLQRLHDALPLGWLQESLIRPTTAYTG